MVWFTRTLPTATADQKRAYRLYLYIIMNQLGSEAWEEAPKDPDGWRRLYDWGQSISRTAVWGRVLAVHSANDFAGFDPSRFWTTAPKNTERNWWYEKSISPLSRVEKRAYRLIIAHTLSMFPERFPSSEPHTAERKALMNLGSNVRAAYFLARWLHNLAQFSAYDFAGFDTSWFWNETVNIGSDPVLIQDIAYIKKQFHSDAGSHS